MMIFFLIILLEESIQKVITFEIFHFIMNETFDREKIVECMFDPITASILAELENGEKECSFLAKQSSISESEVLERLSYLIEHGIIEDGDNFEE